jgi:chemotaxis signal transduction protein
MISPANNLFRIPDEIRILIFSVADIGFGIDMDHIRRMYSPDQINHRDHDLYYFHELLSFGSIDIEYVSPMILLVNDPKRNAGIFIDRPEDINVPVPLSAVCPMPDLIHRSNPFHPIWAVALIRERMIQLVDFHKLFTRRPPEAKTRLQEARKP